jgi:hypothetical protein
MQHKNFKGFSEFQMKTLLWGNLWKKIRLCGFATNYLVIGEILKSWNFKIVKRN